MAKMGGQVIPGKNKLELDLFYLKHLSIMLHLAIIFETAKVMLVGRGGQVEVTGGWKEFVTRCAIFCSFDRPWSVQYRKFGGDRHGRFGGLSRGCPGPASQRWFPRGEAV